MLNKLEKIKRQASNNTTSFIITLFSLATVITSTLLGAHKESAQIKIQNKQVEIQQQLATAKTTELKIQISELISKSFEADKKELINSAKLVSDYQIAINDYIQNCPYTNKGPELLKKQKSKTLQIVTARNRLSESAILSNYEYSNDVRLAVRKMINKEQNTKDLCRFSEDSWIKLQNDIVKLMVNAFAKSYNLSGDHPLKSSSITNNLIKDLKTKK